MYRLLGICPLGGLRPVSFLENALHLSLIGCMTTYILGFASQAPYFALLSEMIRSVCKDTLVEDWMDQEFFIRALFMGNASVFTRQDDIWLIPKIKETALGHDLNTWEDTRRTLAKFPWINALHDKSGQALWEMVFSTH